MDHRVAALGRHRHLDGQQVTQEQIDKVKTVYLLGFKMNLGIQGIWYGLLTGLSVAAVLLFRRFHLLTKKLIPVPGS